jgi:hypothetical protein
MSVGFVYAKIRRAAPAAHIVYAFQRSTTPPGSESSSSPAASDALLPVVAKGSSTNAAARGCDGPTRTRRRQSAKVDRGIPSRSQNASAERPLASHRSNTFRHSAALRFTRPAARTRPIDASFQEGDRSTADAEATEERRSLTAYIAPEEFTAAVDQRLRSGYGVGVSDLLAENFARAAQRAGWTPHEFVLWLAEIEGLEPVRC